MYIKPCIVICTLAFEVGLESIVSMSFAVITLLEKSGIVTLSVLMSQISVASVVMASNNNAATWSVSS